jgi:hypothetical protein
MNSSSTDIGILCVGLKSGSAVPGGVGVPFVSYFPSDAFNSAKALPLHRHLHRYRYT